jgi:hypothetical protein
MKGLYDRLGVSQNASPQEIRNAYKNRSRQLHPDKGGNKEDMQRLNEAYKLLTNPEALKKWEAEHPEENDFSGFDFLPSHGERPSERYRRTLHAMSSFFETNPAEKINSTNKIKAFEDLNKPLMNGLLTCPQYQNLYRVKEDSIVYENVYEYINHKTKWSDAVKPFTSSFLLEPLTLTKGFNILCNFLAGEYYGEKLKVLIQYMRKQLVILKNQTYDARFYEAVLNIVSALNITENCQQITKALDDINCFIYQRHLMETQSVIRLIQNKYFRYFVATVLKQDWQSYTIESPKDMLLYMKSELNYLRRLVPMSHIHSTLEAKVRKLLSNEISVTDLIDMGYVLIDLMVTSVTSFSRINTGIMAALCIHQAAKLETNESKIMALEFISLCLYQNSLTVAFNTNILIAFYTSNQIIRCLNFLQYDQSTPNIGIIETYLTQPGDNALLNFSGSIISNLKGTIKRALYLVDIVPFYVLPKSTLDGELIEIFQMGMLRFSLEQLLATKEGLMDSSFDQAKIIYHAYELTLIHWRTEERNDELEQKVIDLKLRSIEALLHAEGSNINQMAEMIDKPYINMKRNEDGWFSQDQSLDFSAELGLKIYSDIHGIEFNEDTLEFRFIMEEWTNDKPAHEKLFTEFDIRQMLYFGIQGGFISLDHHDANKLYDTIQNILYGPETLPLTEFFKTLFITDYLLKTFTTGAEISGRAPFLVRSSDTLLSRLPEHLQQVLKICTKNSSNSGHCHRFWITAGAIDKNTDIKDNNKKILYTDPVMRIQKQLLQIDPNGELKDAPIDSDDNSNEAIFARDFTKYYDEIGSYFPEFLRLKKLVKISAAVLELSCIRNNNLLKLKQTKQVLDDNKFWSDVLAENLTKSTNNINQGYEQLPTNLRNMLQKLHPISDTNWWDNVKYQIIYNEKCAILSQAVKDFPKFSFNLYDPEVTKTYNELYNENYTRLYNENYLSNKNVPHFWV